MKKKIKERKKDNIKRKRETKERNKDTLKKDLNEEK